MQSATCVFFSKIFAFEHEMIKNNRIFVSYKKQAYLGPSLYYFSKKVGGWGRPNSDVCWHGGLVGVVKYRRKLKKKDITSEFNSHD